ncbi:acyltransferase [Massilia sp. ZL223]|uniref:acyltransferase family protein n=1 Tax=Massilia sp. ZL223 TaxID=2824904 RepID=UPI001B836AF2|nr:acyltransferase family protein [Massilia sp. ZL223]MBQ5962509.1 acyltransferase [Massilia sp. ZL223]
MGAAPSLDRAFSIYLDLVRFLAALAVVAMHFAQLGILKAPWAGQLTMLGREAVVAFFVLSGFVIAYTTHQRRPTARDYVVARCARLYSVALPVLLLAFAAAALQHGAGGMDLSQDYRLTRPYLYIPFHLLFLGDVWTLSEVPPLLAPWWSLNYEAWYYVLFGVVSYMRGAARLAVGALVLAIMGIKLWLLLPVWLSGVLLYHWQARHTMPRTLARIGWVLSIALLAAYELSNAELQLRLIGRSWTLAQAFPLGNADRFLADYAVAVIVCLNFACARHAGFEVMIRMARPIRRLASYTFTLYLSHALVLAAWPALYPHHAASPADWIAAAVAVAVATWVLGMLTEQRKDSFRAPFERLFQLAGGKVAPSGGRLE